MTSKPVSSHIIQSMQTYYNERAQEYDEWFYRQGRYDHGPEQNKHWFSEVQEVVDQLNLFHLTGSILELAPGTGIWTEKLITTANVLTAVDGSLEMIAINKTKVASDRVYYIHADLFTWQPEYTYDAVFFGFWISHIPLERLDAFFHSLATMIRPGGKIFFVDSRREPTITAIDHQLPAKQNQIMRRKLNNGNTFEIVKNFYDPVDLQNRAQKAGLSLTVKETTMYFLYGYGTRNP